MKYKSILLNEILIRVIFCEEDAYRQSMPPEGF